MKAHERAHGRGALRILAERCGDAFTLGAVGLEVAGNGDERRHYAGEVVVEGGPHGEAVIEGFGGGANGAAEVETADVGLRVELERDHDEGSAHRGADDVGFARRAEAFAEVLTQGFGLRVGLREGPAGLRIGALNDGVVALKERLLVAGQALSDVEGDGLLSIAVVVDDKLWFQSLGMSMR